jgi:hypothetical protein
VIIRCDRSGWLLTRRCRRWGPSLPRFIRADWIPPEKLLRAMLLQAFYSIRSEGLLMERLEYDLLFRWFVGIGVDSLGPFGVLEEPRPAAGR